MDVGEEMLIDLYVVEVLEEFFVVVSEYYFLVLDLL